MTTKIKRSSFKTFLRVGSVGTPAWALIADGMVDASIDYGPKTTEETYIDADSATISLDSYAPKFPISGTAKFGDVVFGFIDNLRKTRAVLGDAETDIVNVWLYKTPANGYYAAEKQAVSIQLDKFGGKGGDAAGIDYTINFLGDHAKGIFKPAATAAFAAQPVLAELATMVIGSVTLAPLFAADHSNLLYTGSVPNATTTVAMTSTCIAAGAVVVQYNAAAEVSQAANATLAVGVNHLRIQITVGAEVVNYYIDITRAAA
jgi:hypothetical protein